MLVGARIVMDFQSATTLLEELEVILDRTEDSGSLLPALDQLLDLAYQHPAAWEPRFKAIVDLLVGWHVDGGTTAAVRQRIGDVLGSLTIQWSDAADFGQDLLEYFISDIEAIIVDATPESTAANETIANLLSCFQIIVKALISQASLDPDRLRTLQDRTVEVLLSVITLSEIPHAIGGDIILSLSLGQCATFYGLQPKATRYLLAQIDRMQTEKAAWANAISTMKKILAAWLPNLHPMVTLEVSQPSNTLMRSRWILPSYSRHIQDVLEIVLAAIPNTPSDTTMLGGEYRDISLQAWSSVMQEVEDILGELPLGNSLSRAKHSGSLVDSGQLLHVDHQGSPEPLHVQANGSLGPYTGLSTSSLMSGLTFDVLLLIEMARFWPHEASSIFLRLLGTVDNMPELRLAVIVRALQEISARRGYFLTELQSANPTDVIGIQSLALGTSLHFIQTLVTHWKVLSGSVKRYTITWTVGILRAVQEYRDTFSASSSWLALKKALSSNLHQFIIIAGADEDEQIRAVIACVFETFISAFGSFSLGPQLMASMVDRTQDVCPSVSKAWKNTLFRSNPFVFAFDCYTTQETDITRALKILLLRSPYTGVFRYPHFNSVISALVPQDKSRDEDENISGIVSFAQDGDMLQRLFHACQGKDILSKVNTDSSTEQVETLQHSYNLLMYWSLWEMSKYCVLSRLRTPFGGPQQTLDAFEKQLNSLLQSDQKIEAKNARLFRLRDFLLFLDRLELQFYNAHHGTALGVIPPTPKPVIAFIRMNKFMWDDWFARIRSRVIQGGKATGEYGIVIRNGYVLLSELFSTLSRGAIIDILPWLDDFDRTLVDLVEALVATNASDALSGLHTWCRRAIKDMTKTTSSGRSKHSRSERSTQYPRYRNANLNEGQATALSQISLDWINTAVLHAQHRYEQSVSNATSLMEACSAHDIAEDLGPQAEFLCNEISDSLRDLGSYQQLQTFLDSIPVDQYASQTLPWSDDSAMQSLRAYCLDDAPQAWKHLEEFYDKNVKDSQLLGLVDSERTGLIGQNYMFASKICQQAGGNASALDRLRLEAFRIVQPSAEFLVRDGLEHAAGVLIDTMMLNTPAEGIPKAISEFMDQLSRIPDEMKMSLLRKDMRYWSRLDAMVNLAKKHASRDTTLILKQSNEFKFLLSKVARRTECHNFASSIPRTWEGSLSPAIQFEEAKAAMVKHDYSAALGASKRILEGVKCLSSPEIDERSMTDFQSRIYLKLAKWSRSTKPALSQDDIKAFEDILNLDHDIEQSAQARIESITTGALQKAIEVGINYRKSWFAFGTHHYKQGWGILDEIGSSRFQHPVAVAANDSLKSILSSAGVDRPEEHAKSIFCVFVKHCASGQPFDEMVAYESIRTHVIKLEQLAGSEAAISEIVGIFQTLLRRILETYRLAIHGYFRFLQFASLEFECHQPKSKKTSGEEAADEISQSAISDEITATLRLLRLLAKHGGQLYDAFHENLVDINVSPWTNIIPQLFARLDHPEKPVQSLIADLLCKIGDQYPQLIVFHCVVGANSAHNTSCQRRLLGVISEFLMKSHPDLVSQVRHLIRELERVTVLWEEVWYKKIMMGLPELKSTLQELTEQYQGLDTISGLGPDDKNAVMSDNYHQSVIPLLATFESLQDANARPESNHERWFISAFRDRIQSALDCLRTPKAWNNLFEGFTMLKEICMDIGKELSGLRVLQLSDLSPDLASIQSSLIDMPNPSQSTGVTIRSFEQKVMVIPTKTKPKKLTLLGSDGKRYTYLFKGLEDLHLDERVMQLLRITNGMLQRDKESNSRQLSARHYAVVPLSDNSGMIQWVENTVSIFTIIAKWQHRELMCTRLMNDDGASMLHQTPPRATDLYHEKAAVALKKAGLPSNHPRRQWPKSILLDLYHEMASETPADLLERELWSSSPTPGEWWQKSVQFARSTAVMSMIGYVIGLGDRHLENILIDFTTGDLVHIDYNVCFEKGKMLRIPEVVPFRLSRNMLTSLGVTGVEGNFRVGCEQTMKVMRKNKEILVTLLEAFIYDPLVDWQIEAATAQVGGVGGGGGGTGNGTAVGGLETLREGLQGLVQDSESDTSSVSGTNTRDSRSSFDTNYSARSLGHRRRLSSESVASVGSMSIKSTTTIDSSNRRWNVGAGDQVDSTPTSATLSLGVGASNYHQLQHQHKQSPLQDQHQQPPQHQRNSIAVNILRRVRHKLEGRDFDAVKKCKVTEQVERVIQEATNVENLANMFEGWTPWL
ncbi:Serine/threonine-protein kinase smg1 [Mortierella sp. GBA30]|nr:Serine/threonine-protein kinase smg1 [Mortierella sp. GBA30]